MRRPAALIKFEVLNVLFIEIVILIFLFQITRNSNFRCTLDVLPMKGNCPPTGGMMSTTTSIRTMRDRNAVNYRDTFSPDSFGNRNPITQIIAITVPGITRTTK